jgi:hypothetical protein
MDMKAWKQVKSAGEIPAGSAQILHYRINGTEVNGINGQRFTYTDAVKALAISQGLEAGHVDHMTVEFAQ